MSDAQIIAFPSAQQVEGSVTEPAPARFEEWSPIATAHLTSLVVDMDELDEDGYFNRLTEIAEFIRDTAISGGRT